MNCEFESKVSLLLDDALSDDEAAAIRRHISECESCRLLEQDFAHLGRAIRSFEAGSDASSEAALDAVLSNRSFGFWRRRVSVPLPLATAATLLLAALGIWAAYGELSDSDRVSRVTGVRETRPPATEPVGLDRFDRGHRALIYKVPRDTP